MPLSDSDIAADRDNKNWDPVILSVHTYAGYVYDYSSSSFGREGLDDRNLRLPLIANPARPETQSVLISQYPTFFNTAQYRGNGLMVFGAGTVNNGIVTGGPRGGALDIVGHEYTHGVTQFSSRLISQNESGALNESFSDIMGVAVKFHYQPVGSGLARAEWLLGEDATSVPACATSSRPT